MPIEEEAPPLLEKGTDGRTRQKSWTFENSKKFVTFPQFEIL